MGIDLSVITLSFNSMSVWTCQCVAIQIFHWILFKINVGDLRPFCFTFTWNSFNMNSKKLKVSTEVLTRFPFPLLLQWLQAAVCVSDIRQQRTVNSVFEAYLTLQRLWKPEFLTLRFRISRIRCLGQQLQCNFLLRLFHCGYSEFSSS